MSKELADKLGEMDLQGVDVTDANAVAQMMGYNEGEAATTTTAATTEGDTTTATPTTAAPAPADAPAAPAAPAASPPAAAPAAAVATVDSSATPAAAADTTSEIAGVLTKDGKHVIPHKVLQDSRTAASIARQRAEELESQNTRLQQELDDLKAGKSTGTEEVTEDVIADMEENFPERGKQMRVLFDQVQNLRQQVAQSTAAAKPSVQTVAEQEASQAAVIDEMLAARPLLSKYREIGGLIWDRAVEIDKEILADKSLAGIDGAARFAKVEERLAGELGIALPASTQTTAAAPATTAAAPATPAAPAAPAAPAQPTQIMPTLTDLGGGSVAVGDPMSGMTAGQMVDKAMSMDMESLRRMAGLSY